MSETPTSAQLEAVATLTDIALFEVDAHQNVVAVSPEMTRLTGFSREEVLGRSCLSLVRCPQCLKGCGVFERGEVHDVPLTLFRKDGSELRVLKSGRVLRGADDAIVGAIETIRAFEEREPAPAPGELDGLLAGLGRMVLTADCRGCVVEGSTRLAELVGREPSELPGVPLADLLGEALFGVDGVLTGALESGERREGWRAELRHRDGSTIPVSVSTAPVPDAAAGCTDGDVRSIVMLRTESRRLEDGSEPDEFHGIVARAPRMREIFRLIELLQGNDAAVLIDGESGTGKELIARAIHRTSHRSGKPLVTINCAAIPSELIESELFGHARGAFTGAVRDREGKFEAADGGTLFLDEIGDLPLMLQGKLLRAIQEQSFERVGENRTRKVDVRVIAATNRDLAKGAATGAFREDLYYRLRVIPIHVPPLRARREDTALLLRHALERIGHRHGRALRLSPSASRVLLAYDWPGNVRELENVVEYATTVCEGQTIHVHDLPPEVTNGSIDAPEPGDAGALLEMADPGSVQLTVNTPVAETVTASVGGRPELAHLPPVRRIEAERILEALEAERFHRGRAADRLEMSRTTLWRKLREFGL